MVMTDPIADMLTRIRNANQMKNEIVKMPASRTKAEIARILKEEGYIIDYTIDTAEKKTLTLVLKYVGTERTITNLKRISKPGLRIYASADNLPKVLNGLGIAIISTSKGSMTDKQARAERVGGEVLAYVW